MTPPTPSATVLLLRERDHGIEVLMVKRSAAASFASALVFPGGKIDADDADPAWLDRIENADGLDVEARSLRIAGWREVFEETGLLPLACATGSPTDRSVAFIDLVRDSGARLPLAPMPLFARWITPRMAPRRFDTHFFLAGLDDEAICDGVETVAAEWLRPETALALGEAGERNLLFPTRSQLRRLVGLTSIDQAYAVAAAHSVTAIEPQVEVRPSGVVMTIPSGVGYEVVEEAIEGDEPRPGPDAWLRRR